MKLLILFTLCQYCEHRHQLRGWWGHVCHNMLSRMYAYWEINAQYLTFLFCFIWSRYTGMRACRLNGWGRIPRPSGRSYRECPPMCMMCWLLMPGTVWTMLQGGNAHLNGAVVWELNYTLILKKKNISVAFLTASEALIQLPCITWWCTDAAAECLCIIISYLTARENDWKFSSYFDVV